MKKYGAYGCSYSAKVNIDKPSDNLLIDSLDVVENMLKQIINEVKEKCSLTNKDRMRVMITSTMLHKPISTKLVSVQEQTPQLILTEMEKV